MQIEIPDILKETFGTKMPSGVAMQLTTHLRVVEVRLRGKQELNVQTLTEALTQTYIFGMQCALEEKAKLDKKVK